MLSLTALLLLQGAYCGLALGFNLASLRRTSRGDRPLTPMPPKTGLAFVAAYGGSLAMAMWDNQLPFRVSMACLAVLGARGGILQHLARYRVEPSAYASRAAWAGAVGLNTFGLVLTLLAVLGAYVPR